jgi:hypothetical protein
MRAANMQNEDGGAQPTYARDTDEDGGGEDKVEAHSTAGFTLCVLLVIPPSTSTIPHSKTAVIMWRGSTDRYCIVRGVKCPISNLGGFTVPNSIVRGVIWTSFQAKVIQILNSGNSNKLQISSIQGK